MKRDLLGQDWVVNVSCAVRRLRVLLGDRLTCGIKGTPWEDLRGSNLTANTTTTAYEVGARGSQIAGRSSRINSITISPVSSSSIVPFVTYDFHYIILYQLY
jgi:hypothetical protein